MDADAEDISLPLRDCPAGDLEGEVDFAYSTLQLHRHTHYLVRLNDEQGNPRIEEVLFVEEGRRRFELTAARQHVPRPDGGGVFRRSPSHGSDMAESARERYPGGRPRSRVHAPTALCRWFLVDPEEDEHLVGRREAQFRYVLTTCVVCAVWFFGDNTSVEMLIFFVLGGLGIARLQIAFQNRRWFSGRGN